MEALNLYVIYGSPTDYPDQFVVRRWENNEPKELVGLANTLKEARELLPQTGLYNLGRYMDDDPAIEEVWI